MCMPMEMSVGLQDFFQSAYLLPVIVVLVFLAYHFGPASLFSATLRGDEGFAWPYPSYCGYHCSYMVFDEDVHGL